MSLSIFIIIFILLIMVCGQTTKISNTQDLEVMHRDHLMAKYDYPFLDFPYFVNVFSDYGEDVHTYKFICSASLISYYWSITAASCYLSVSNASYIIYAGIIPDPIITIDQYPGEYLRGEWRSISKWIIHPNYAAENLPTNDIALLYIEVPFNINIYIGLVRLIPYSLLNGCDVSLKFKSCRIPVYENKTLGFNNKFVFLRVFLTDARNCRVNIGDKNKTGGDPHICSTTGIEMGSRGCLGSLGSPLICNEQQVGIMLNVYGCSEANNALYTRVDIYQEWIKKYVTVGLKYIDSKREFQCHRRRGLQLTTGKTSAASLLGADCFSLFYLVIVNCSYYVCNAFINLK